MQSLKFWTAGFSLLAFLIVVAPAKADLHFWRINEVFSNAAGNVQFIEMREAFGQNGQDKLATSGAFAHTFDTNAINPAYIYPNDLSSTATANKFFLMATSDFDALPNSPTPDYIIQNNFFFVTGDTLNFANGVDTFTFTNGQLPLDNTSSMNRVGTSGNNFNTGLNSPTNFAGITGSVVAPEPSGLFLAAMASVAFLALSRRAKKVIAL